MLERLTITNLGPAPELKFEFAQRLNLITGDNGLGKTFALELAWYALTRTWADHRLVLPNPMQRWGTPSITYAVHGVSGPAAPVTCTFDAGEQLWRRPGGRPPIPGLVIYARLDGGFSVWDPARNYWREQIGPRDAIEALTAGSQRERPASFEFTKKEVWYGLHLGEQTICNGLLADVDKWRLSESSAFVLLQSALAKLSPDKGPPLEITGSTRVSVDDVRDVPTIDLGYGVVPITQASAGIRRVLSLAYLLVWAWSEHAFAAGLRQEEPTDQIVLLFDEIEAHLHPQWQRVFLPALQDLLEAKLAGRKMNVQVIATTHAPLVFASVEPLFDEGRDGVFTFDQKGSEVEMRRMEWSMRGDASSWLRSPYFGLEQARSKASEQAIEVAESWMRGERTELPEGLETQEAIDARLRDVLPEFDRFWPRWIGKMEANEPDQHAG